MKTSSYLPVSSVSQLVRPIWSPPMSSPVVDRPRVADTAPDRRSGGRTRVFALPQVRWATAASVLFALGLAAQFGGAPAWVWWALYLACYVTGGGGTAAGGVCAVRGEGPSACLLVILRPGGAAAVRYRPARRV